MLDDLKNVVEEAAENLRIACHNYLVEKFGDNYSLDDGEAANSDPIGRMMLAITTDFDE